jgi:hypothetical protein
VSTPARLNPGRFLVAIDEGHEIRSPFRGIKRGKGKPRTRVLTLDEQSLLLEALHPRFQRFVRLALGTGCHLDEIHGIDPKRDIDWTRGTVHVTGKFRKERDVPMQPDARAALEEQLEEEGKLWTQNLQRLREVLAESSARAKVPPLTPHAPPYSTLSGWENAPVPSGSGLIEIVRRRQVWDELTITWEDNAQFPRASLSWHEGHGLVLHCFEDELSWGFFLAESAALSQPDVDIVLGGQVQERWPRQLFVDPSLSVEALLSGHCTTKSL